MAGVAIGIAEVGGIGRAAVAHWLIAGGFEQTLPTAQTVADGVDDGGSCDNCDCISSG